MSRIFEELRGYSRSHPEARNKGELWEYTDKRGRVYQGRIKNIATMRTGAVLAFFENGRGFPVTKYGSWRRIG